MKPINEMTTAEIDAEIVRRARQIDHDARKRERRSDPVMDAMVNITLAVLREKQEPRDA